MTRFERGFVCAGGAMFAASLCYCAYSYLVRWSTADADGDWTGVAADALLFSLFALHHSVFARDAVKRQLARRIPDGLLRSTYVWVAALLLFATCALWRRIGWDIYRSTGWLYWLQAGVQLGGLWWIAGAVNGLDALELAGIRPATITGGLKTSGLYRFVRHPLYFGWLLAVFGTPHLTGDRLVFAAISAAYLVVAVPWEERSLVRIFGDDYTRYQQRVRWRLVPFIY